MMYWDMILKEVLDKNSPALECTFSSEKDYNPCMISGMVQEERVKIPGFRRFKKYPLGESYPGIYFTEREAQTIFHFLYGRTTVEVAEILGLSRRTIEFYVKNMKIKLNCRLKSELVCKVRGSEFMDHVDFD
jgi:DNA-binding CsgD family transcriptional regulator